ncbi:MAG TPA: adenylate/guanylate cyclase domain-containing protein, partial [Nitrososphaeraceae archaeon]|nr:adenylate/guanylate cyclase domain-containing protein [Nitrososphaeraceae archaeon]
IKIYSSFYLYLHMNYKNKLYYYYYLVIDLECSSSQNIPLNIQIEKLEKLRLCVNKILNSKTDRLHQKKVRYINSTGDGYFIIFDIGEDALKFSIDLHKYLNEHNKKIKNKKIYSQEEIDSKTIIVNTGISCGISKPLKQIDGQIAYWGSDVILSHRIVDYAKGGYILCSSDVYKNMKNTKFGEFVNLECSTNFKHNLKTDVYLFYNKEDKEKFENVNIHLLR